MQSACVEIGLERAAFIHVADLRENRQNRSLGEQAVITPIEKLLFEGQSLLVQVAKDPLGTKGARLSTHISIAGRMLVYLPHDAHIGISQRIGPEDERNALRARILQTRPEDQKQRFIVPHPTEGTHTPKLADATPYHQT